MGSSPLYDYINLDKDGRSGIVFASVTATTATPKAIPAKLQKMSSLFVMAWVAVGDVAVLGS